MAAVITQPPWAVTPGKIQEAVRRLVAASHPLRIIMFGSQSRGDGHQDSDLDLVVIEREVPDRVAEMIRLERALRGMVLPTDILVISEKDFKEWAETPGNVYYDAQRDGKVLYEAV
jgi:predicted nucleotidyltransferase